MNYKIYKGDVSKDKDDFIGFWKENFPKWPESKYKWLYENSLYGLAHFWVARCVERNDKFVGTTVLFPKRLFVEGKPVNVGVAGDFGVARAHRGFGPAGRVTAMTIKYMYESRMAFIYATPNIVSEKVATRHGAQVIGRIVRMVKVLKTAQYLRRFLKVDFPAKVLAFPVDKILELISRDYFYKSGKKYNFEVLSDFDERFDRLWERALKNYPLVGERTRDFLHWRFASCPFKKFTTFALTNKDSGEIAGFITYRFENGNLIIADLFSENTGDILESLLASFLKYQRKHGTEVVTFVYFGNKKVIDVFSKFGFSLRSDNRSIVVNFDESYSLNPLVSDENSWHFLEGDNDA